MTKKSIIIISLYLISLFFYFSPISFYGYWTDAVFLVLTVFGVFIFRNRIAYSFLRESLYLVSLFSLLAVAFNTLSIFHGITPVHFIPKEKLSNECYAYFIKRGNLGATNGCFGEIQYHQQVAYLPFLEVKIETDDCSALDYMSIMSEY